MKRPATPTAMGQHLAWSPSHSWFALGPPVAENRICAAESSGRKIGAIDLRCMTPRMPSSEVDLHRLVIRSDIDPPEVQPIQHDHDHAHPGTSGRRRFARTHRFGRPTPTMRMAPTARVLHVINGEHYAGAERVQDLLAAQLPNFGFDVGFACVKLGRFADARTSRSVPLFEAPMQWRFDLRPAWRIAEMIRMGATGWCTRTRRGRRSSARWPCAAPACRSCTTSIAQLPGTRRIGFAIG